MVELIKFLYKILRHLLRHTGLILLRFLIWLRQYLIRFAKWVLLPKVYKSILGILVFLIPLAVTFYIYKEPHIDVVFTDPLKSDNIFTSKFTIENNGNSNIYDVSVNHILSDFKAVTNNFTYSNNKIDSYTYNDVLYKRIASNKKQVYNYDFLDVFGGFANNPSKTISFSAKLELTVNYNYWNFYSKTETYNFSTSRLIDGHIVWVNNQ